TPVENETIQRDAEPGMMIMKILDERELIMPKKVLGLYEGLQASHLNKIANKNTLMKPRRRKRTTEIVKWKSTTLIRDDRTTPT
ncbi:hypothetical protein, partial [Salmonella sp. s54395]|uniref:hypothetical protein n=1 Tax=Salmonella sp. s54395 TaxID=3159664 RepID=UPI00397EEECF